MTKVQKVIYDHHDVPYTKMTKYTFCMDNKHIKKYKWESFFCFFILWKTLFRKEALFDYGKFKSKLWESVLKVFIISISNIVWDKKVRSFQYAGFIVQKLTMDWENKVFTILYKRDILNTLVKRKLNETYFTAHIFYFDKHKVIHQTS